MPPRSESKGRQVLSYSGRRLRERGGRGEAGDRTAGDGNRNRGGGGRQEGRSYRRDNSARSGAAAKSESRSATANSGGRRFRRRGGAPQASGNEASRRNVPLDQNTLDLLRSLQQRIKVLEGQRGPLTNSRGEAVQRFGRRVDRAVGEQPRNTRRPASGGKGAAGTQPRQRKPQQRRQRSPDARQRNSRRPESRFDEGRRGGVRDRKDWDDGEESRSKRRRRDWQGPAATPNPNNLPTLRVHVRR